MKSKAAILWYLSLLKVKPVYYLTCTQIKGAIPFELSAVLNMII